MPRKPNTPHETINFSAAFPALSLAPQNAVLTSVLPVGDHPFRGCEGIRNVSLTGNAIPFVFSTEPPVTVNAAACCGLCRSYADCLGFSYSLQTSWCTLMANITGAVADDDAITGINNNYNGSALGCSSVLCVVQVFLPPPHTCMLLGPPHFLMFLSLPRAHVCLPICLTATTQLAPPAPLWATWQLGSGYPTWATSFLPFRVLDPGGKRAASIGTLTTATT